MPSRTVNVFVSYSHADASLVAPVVKLLRVNESLVFQDTDRIPPGKKWRDEIARALAEANLVVVFWCDHACRSTEVSTEWKTAIEQDKDVLPLLLDATPLPSELGQFQWIDFRGTVGANHDPIESPVRDTDSAAHPPAMSAPPRSASAPRRKVWYVLAGVAAIAIVVLLSSLLWFSASHQSPYPGPEPEPSGSVPIGWITLALGVAIAVGAYVLRRRRTKPGRRIEKGAPHREAIERRIALELEAEILRRAASAHDRA